jgi:hypothetical protein
LFVGKNLLTQIISCAGTIGPKTKKEVTIDFHCDEAKVIIATVVITLQ